MHEHHLALNIVRPGHPGETPPVGPGHRYPVDVFRHAAEQAELLRARMRQLELVCGGRPCFGSEAR